MASAGRSYLCRARSVRRRGNSRKAKRVCYHLLTERFNKKGITKILDKYLPERSWNYQKAKGYWHGKKEKALIIEIMGLRNDRLINKIAHEIKVLNRQEAVLVQRIANNNWLVTR